MANKKYTFDADVIIPPGKSLTLESLLIDFASEYVTLTVAISQQGGQVIQRKTRQFTIAQLDNFIAQVAAGTVTGGSFEELVLKVVSNLLPGTGDGTVEDL